MLHQHGLAAAVALVHAVQLRHGHVRLVDEHQEVLGKEVEQRVRRLARLAARQDAGVVLDAVAVAQLAQHLHVVLGALAQTEGLQLLALRLQLGHPRLELGGDLRQRPLDGVLRGDEVGGRIDGHRRQLLDDLLGERVDLDDLLHLVAPQAHPQRVVVVGGPDLEAVAAHPELAPGEADVVALVVDLHQLGEHLVPADVVTLLEQHHLPQILLRASPGRRCTTPRPR